MTKWKALGLLVIGLVALFYYIWKQLGEPPPPPMKPPKHPRVY
jgi:hypothetical protein